MLAARLAEEARGEDVRSAAEELTKESDLGLGALRNRPRRRGRDVHTDQRLGLALGSEFGAEACQP